MLNQRSFSRQVELVRRLRNRHFVLLDIIILCVTPVLSATCQASASCPKRRGDVPRAG